MPKAPRKPCSYSGCPELTFSPTGYCEQHRKKRHKEYTKYNRDPDESKYYKSKAWKQLRAAQLFTAPNCKICGQSATVADHIRPRKSGGTDALDNLQSLCNSCASIKTAKQDGGFGRPARKRWYYYPRRMWTEL